ncbi:hypothetical protein BC936DRAFT_147973, partial [Jimgerdemannia flammicorona]
PAAVAVAALKFQPNDRSGSPPSPSPSPHLYSHGTRHSRAPAVLIISTESLTPFAFSYSQVDSSPASSPAASPKGVVRRDWPGSPLPTLLCIAAHIAIDSYSGLFPPPTGGASPAGPPLSTTTVPLPLAAAPLASSVFTLTMRPVSVCKCFDHLTSSFVVAGEGVLSLEGSSHGNEAMNGWMDGMVIGEAILSNSCDPVVVLVLSLCFIASVFGLHIMGKFLRK